MFKNATVRLLGFVELPEKAKEAPGRRGHGSLPGGPRCCARASSGACGRTHAEAHEAFAGGQAGGRVVLDTDKPA